jgi:hypothetical protein
MVSKSLLLFLCYFEEEKPETRKKLKKDKAKK